MALNAATRFDVGPQHVYWKINEAICQAFLSGKFSHAPVYLDFEDEAHSALAVVLECSENEVNQKISEAVSGVICRNVTSPFEFFENSFEAWKSRNYQGNPPFIALLSALSIAAENMCSDGDFKANNYYDRLFQFLHIEDEALQSRIRQKFKLTRRYWEAWNSWLIENDGNFGLPTAQQLNAYKYVSYAMSQALVREAERKNLQKMFEHFDLTPGQQMSPEELYPYIQKWVTNFGSRTLKTLWKSKGIDHIVTQIASHELLNWSGPVNRSRDAGALSRKILLGAQWQGFPNKLRFFLAAQSPGLKAGDQLLVETSGSRNAFNGIQQLSLSTCAIPNSFTLGPAQNILIDAFLMTEVVLSAGETEKFSRRSRPIIALALDEGGTYYSEVSRVSLLNPHIVLCRAGAKGFVAGFLQSYARPGFQEVQPSEAQNLPAGWAAFRDVQIFQAAENVDENMQVLVPLSDTSLMIMGGIKLTRNTWHCRAPLEVSATLRDKNFNLNVIEQKLGEDGVCIKLSESSNGSAIATLDPRQLGRNLNFLCVMERDGEVIKSQHLSLRDADKPLKVVDGQYSQLAYTPSVDRPLGALSAEVIEGDFALELSRQATVADYVAGNGSPHERLRVFDFQGDDTESGEEFSNNSGDYGSSSAEIVGQENCASRGRHSVWICQPHDRNSSQYADKWMKCSQCGYVVVVKKRETAKSKPVAVTPRPLVLPERQKAVFEEDIFLDAFCFLGGGSWNQASNMCAHIEGGDLSAYRYIRNLIALGHMDVKLDLPHFRPKAWSISPPFFFETHKGELVLSGYRCGSLVSKLEEVSRSAGIEITYHEQRHAPARIALRNGTGKLTSDVLSGVADPHGRVPILAGNLSEVWIARCPAMSSIEDALPVVHIELAAGVKTEKFDFLDGKWKLVSDDRDPGAYRSSSWNAPHYYVDGNGRKKKASQEVVKFLASRHARISLVDYLAGDFALATPLGCPLPGVYERAVIASSGYLPVQKSGRLIYRDVKLDIANAVRDRLYS